MKSSNWSLSGAWKIPTNTFSLFSRKTKPYYGKSLPAAKTETTKQLIEAYEVEEDNKGNIHVDNATSWATTTHPDGAGPSKLVDDIDYNRDTKDLTVKYRNGFTAVYHNIEPGEAWTFASSASKGQWAHNHLWNKPYDRG